MISDSQMGFLSNLFRAVCTVGVTDPDQVAMCPSPLPNCAYELCLSSTGTTSWKHETCKG